MRNRPCQCEHENHFTYPLVVHDYLSVLAGAQTMIFVGPVCDACKRDHDPADSLDWTPGE